MIDGAWLGLPVATGVGLLVGIERERRKGRGPLRQAAGLRTFTLVCMAGALARLMGTGALVAVGAAAIAMLAAIAYWRSTARPDSEHDPGLTTEVALLVIYLVGVQCAADPIVGAGCGVMLAALLAARERLHRFAIEVLSDLEMRDALVLAAVALVVVPLSPAAPAAYFGGVAPRTMALLVLAILGLQAVAYVAYRALGGGRAMLLSGLLGGFVSSTATIATLGAEARRFDAPAIRHQAGAAALSGVATWLQAFMIGSVVSPGLLRSIAAAVVSGSVTLLVASWWLARGVGPRAAAASLEPARRPLRLREALWVAGLLIAVSVAVTALQSRFGAQGLLVGTALTALVDAHAAIAAAFGLHAGGVIDTEAAVTAMLVSLGINTVSRSVIAAASGGLRFGTHLAAALWLSTSVAVLVAWGVHA